jgi:hypothetical protein
LQTVYEAVLDVAIEAVARLDGVDKDPVLDELREEDKRAGDERERELLTRSVSHPAYAVRI